MRKVWNLRMPNMVALKRGMRVLVFVLLSLGPSGHVVSASVWVREISVHM